MQIVAQRRPKRNKNCNVIENLNPLCYNAAVLRTGAQVDTRDLIEKINAELDVRGITRDDLATRARISRVTVWRILTGETKHPRKTTVRQLARALQLTDTAVQEVLSGQYEMLPIVDVLPEDDDLFKKALLNQLEAVPRHLRLEAVRVAMVGMAGIMQRVEGSRRPDPYQSLRQLEQARWNARKRAQFDRSPG